MINLEGDKTRFEILFQFHENDSDFSNSFKNDEEQMKNAKCRQGSFICLQ